jgi:hypothetical protein
MHSAMTVTALFIAVHKPKWTFCLVSLTWGIISLDRELVSIFPTFLTIQNIRNVVKDTATKLTSILILFIFPGKVFTLPSTSTT